MPIPTKIALNFNQIARLEDLNDLAGILFPGNRNHRRAFLAIFVEIKWHGHGPLPNLAFVAEKHGISPRTLERVRAKMRLLGLIDHVSRFSKQYGYREGWVLSTRCERSLEQLAAKLRVFREPGDEHKKQSDRDALGYV